MEEVEQRESVHCLIHAIVLIEIFPLYIAGINPMDAWLNVSVHGVSFFLMMFEMIFSRMQMYMNMVLLIVINVILYMFLSWIVHAT